MAVGLPVIGTPVGGIPDFLKDPEGAGADFATGMFCGVDDHNDLALKIRSVLEKTKLRKKIIKNGADLISKFYNWDMIARKMNSIFESLI